MKKWEKLPEEMRTPEVRPYYEILKKRRLSRFFKRVFDITVSLLMLILLSPLFLVVAIVIKIDSRGPVFYRQERVTRYNRHFRIFKFRTMRVGADKQGVITADHDSRVTRAGKFLRKLRLDETAQLIDVLRGTMSFVGTRPEVPKYVEKYTPEMYATLLMPAGITSVASIRYKDEAKILGDTDKVDEVYSEVVLPGKMKYNLQSIERFGFFREIGVMFMTVFAVLGKDYSDKENAIGNESIADKESADDKQTENLPEIKEEETVNSPEQAEETVSLQAPGEEQGNSEEQESEQVRTENESI